jgi:hypothetical protein
MHAQMITGTWHGRINRQKVEVKIIQEGDSLTGTSYYFDSPNNYRRYSIKGYFDKASNEVVWWDDRLIEQKSGRYSHSAPGKNAMLSRADFNCPGGGGMMLDGKSSLVENEKPQGEVHLDKSGATNFEDEWNYVIENYTVGANDPDIIDSVSEIAFQPKINDPVVIEEKPVVIATPPAKKQVVIPSLPQQSNIVIAPPAPLTIRQKFSSRQVKYTTEIPLSGDSIELRFYDNAEIDGDSISLFLNGELIFEHIRLAAQPYIIRLAVKDLKDSNDLIMVAENLGTIPPNTSYMVAMVGNKRYDANLASSEEMSAAVKLVK